MRAQVKSWPRSILAAALLLGVTACVTTPVVGGPDTTTPTESTTTTSTIPTTTTPAPGSTTTPSSVVDEAEGSGCTPGPGELPDGEWFGYATSVETSQIEFDLACWFTGEPAARAAAEDGSESPPPNDYYIRNENETTRIVSISENTSVVWYPDLGDATSETNISYPQWIIQIEQRDLMPGIWVEIKFGEVINIHEQWVP